MSRWRRNTPREDCTPVCMHTPACAVQPPVCPCSRCEPRSSCRSGGKWGKSPPAVDADGHGLPALLPTTTSLTSTSHSRHPRTTRPVSCPLSPKEPSSSRAQGARGPDRPRAEQSATACRHGLTSDPLVNAFLPPVLSLSSLLSGYIAVHVVQELLSRGYTVRGTVRSSEKGDWLVNKFKGKGDFTYVCA